MFANLKHGLVLGLLGLCGGVLAVPAYAVEIQRWDTPSGARVLFVENAAVPMVDIRLDFDAGSRRDDGRKPGVAGLTLGLLEAGTARLSEEAVQERWGDSAAVLSSELDTDRAGVQLRSLSDPAQLGAAVTLLASLLREPAFPAAILAREKARTIAGLQQAEANPSARGQRALTALLYGNHPYGLSARVTPHTVGEITRGDVQAFWQRHYQARYAVVSMVGNLTRAEAERVARQLTDGLPAGGQDLAAVPAVPPQAAAQFKVLPHPASQTHLFLGVPVLTRHDPDYFPLLVGNYILGGGGFDSRLMKAVRDQRGLTYGVYSQLVPQQEAGEFVLSLSTKAETADEALQVVNATLQQFVAEGATAAELTQAKSNLVGGFPLRFDSNRKLLGYMAVIGFYRLPLDWLDSYPKQVEAVSLAAVREAWQRRIVPAALQGVRVGQMAGGKPPQ